MFTYFMYDRYYSKSIKFQNISNDPVKIQMTDKAIIKYITVFVKDFALSEDDFILSDKTMGVLNANYYSLSITYVYYSETIAESFNTTRNIGSYIFS